jgi:thioredoxin 1
VKEKLRVTDSDFEEEVINSPIPVLVDFWASWCIPSQMMMPVIERLSKEYEGKIKIRKLNVDQNPITREKYMIQGCPTLIIFQEGTEKTRKVGAHSEGQLREIIDSLLWPAEVKKSKKSYKEAKIEK